MSQRPQPVTSKFRNCYVNDIYPIYDDFIKSSSAGSTSSLTSVLYHDSFDDLSSESTDHKSEHEKNFNNINNSSLKPAHVSGMYCKRIIARQPQYPGERVTLTKYDSNINSKSKNVKTNIRKYQSSSQSRLCKSSTTNAVTNSGENVPISQKSVIRKIASKSQSVSEHSNVKKGDSNHDNKSVASNYSNDFSSESGVTPGPKMSVEEKHIIGVEMCSSEADTLSVSIADPSETNLDVVIKKDPSSKLLTAWEAWYLKKEKQKRKKQELELMKEKAKIEKEVEEKSKRSQVCQEKIQSWLIKKEEIHNKEVQTIKKQQQMEKSAKEQKKEELLKKSSEKYVEWKLEKLKREKDLEKQEKEEKVKIDAEKMIKQAKASNAFKRWYEEHKDHQMQVPYSYGISDGKLTSYYDKTSNPPPSFFNPDPWKPIIDIKN